MTETTTVVVGGDRGIGRGVAAALEQRGRRVVVLADGPLDLTDPDSVGAALDEATTVAPVTTVVLAHLDPSAFSVVPLVDLDEPAWEAAAERSLRAAFVILRQVHAVVPDGGRVVVLLPTVAATGAAGLVPLCTAVEGIRVMAKAVARRWGARRITVNTIEVDLAAFVTDDDDKSDDDPAAAAHTAAPASAPTAAPAPVVAQLGIAALPPGSVVADVAGLVEILDSDAGAALTGALLVADRGTVMLP